MDEKKKKPGFTYVYSETLKQNIAISNKTGKVYCEDGTIYTPEEIKILNKKDEKIPYIVHVIKSTFKGEIVDDRTTNQRTTGTKSDNNIQCRNPTTSKPADNSNLQKEQSGPIDLY